MRRVKIGFNVPVPQQIAESRNKVTKITGNPRFPVPTPSMADVTIAIDELEVAYMEALNRDKEKKAIMRIKRKALKDKIVKLADYIQTESGGDEEAILSSGYGVKKLPAPIPVPETPQTVKVNPAKHEGELEIVFKPVKGAKAYALRMYTGSMDEQPVNIGACLKGRFVARNLNSLTRYWFEVIALNPSGASGWSDPAMGITL